MPGLLRHHSNLDSNRNPTTTAVNVEDTQLWLPSSIPAADRARVCIDGLSEIEEKLQTAQCYDALNGVRHVLKIKARMVHFKNQNIRGQRGGTRLQAVIDRVHARARATAKKYRAAQQAKLALAGPGEWESTLRVLDDGDIRSYQDPNKLRLKRGRRGVLEDDQRPAPNPEGTSLNANDDVEMEDLSNLSLFNETRERRDGTGKTRRTLSWIWLSGVRTPEKDDETDNILQAEWAKSRVRAERSKEEVMLLKEEMRRTLDYLSWKAKWWQERANHRQVKSKELAEGLSAYSATQADLLDRLSVHFKVLWKAPLRDAAQDETTAAASSTSPDKPSDTPATSTPPNTSSEQGPITLNTYDYDDDHNDDDDYETDEESNEDLASIYNVYDEDDGDIDDV